ncbi:prostaglandin reductase 1-like [Argonauta hians]
MVLSKKIILSKQFEGKPCHDNFTVATEELPDEVKTGEVLIQALWLSVDPYMRFYQAVEGNVMFGQQLAKVLESKNPKYPKGSLVLAHVGWKTHSLVQDDSVLLKVPDIGDLSQSLTLGTLGMPGLTAYFGLLYVCKAKAGETVLVNAAAGAVGSTVGQIAKIKGCKVVACAGTDEKCAWLKKLGFDEVFNYKKVDLDQVFSALPGGFDCYFDNVGGSFTTTALKYMNDYGRVCICGAISEYNVNDKKLMLGEYRFRTILAKELTITGMKASTFFHKSEESMKDLISWVKSGKLQCKETITEGFDKMPEAFFGLFEGSNIGKAVVKA